MNLEIEMVPKTCWYSNVRSNVTRSTWDIIKRDTAKRNGWCCEICEGKGTDQGYKWPVECHEVWDYIEVDGVKVQKLIKMTSLCPRCHEVKHLGLARVRNREAEALEWLALVNRIREVDVLTLSRVATEEWKERSRHKWKLDISYLERYGVNINQIDRDN